MTPAASTRLLHRAAVVLVASVWLSAALFGTYIVLFFAGALAVGQGERWNRSLPDLYDPGEPLATIGIGAHFVAGGIILALGPLQLIGAVRQRWPRLHRWSGRVYALTAVLAGLGGLLFIAIQGTIGGTPMSIGFSLYGVLMIVAAIQTVRHAMARRIDRHRAWGMRLFALAIGSWLYRMEYGFWFLVTGGIGHTRTFDGPLDVVMAFFFYLPNLLVVELFLRARHTGARRWQVLAAAGLLLAAAAFVVLGTVEITGESWGPSILQALRELTGSG